ncbi:MAG: hypothetical protein IMX05_00740 [Hydrogenibacillus schlegelii]|nr:hypothetical protein [Hydrogenibacillus schlegelii]
MPVGARKTKELGAWADGVWIRARKARPEDAGSLEIQQGDTDEGRSGTGGSSAGGGLCVMAPEDFWEEAVESGRGVGPERGSADLAGRRGAGRVKAGTAWLPEAVFRLDRDPLRRALLEALGSDREAYGRVAERIAEGDWNLVAMGLREARARATRRGKERVRRLEQ